MVKLEGKRDWDKIFTHIVEIIVALPVINSILNFFFPNYQSIIGIPFIINIISNPITIAIGYVVFIIVLVYLIWKSQTYKKKIKELEAEKGNKGTQTIAEFWGKNKVDTDKKKDNSAIEVNMLRGVLANHEKAIEAKSLTITELQNEITKYKDQITNLEKTIKVQKEQIDTLNKQKIGSQVYASEITNKLKLLESQLIIKPQTSELKDITIEGRILNSRGFLVSGAIVTLQKFESNNGTSFYKKANVKNNAQRTGSPGIYRFEFVPPGRYKILVESEEGNAELDFDHESGNTIKDLVV